MYTEEQLDSGEGLSSDRPMKAFTYDGINWQTCEMQERIGGEPIDVVTVPPTEKGGWECRA